MKKLAVITVQSGYLQKIADQLIRIFGNQIELHPIQLSLLSSNAIEPDECVFSAIPNVQKIVNALFPRVNRFIEARRSINVINTSRLLDVKSGKNIVVLSDNRLAAIKIIKELKVHQFDHNYFPYSPETALPETIDYVVTTADVQLVYDLKIVPENFTRVINIGLRVISIETIFEVNDRLGFDIDPATLCKLYMDSLVLVSHNWPISNRNRYVSSWIGHQKANIAKYHFSDFTVHSPIMKDLLFRAKRMARKKDPIHISGKMGVGKRRLSQAIHNISHVSDLSFLSINCGSRPGESLEKELFGWEENGNIYPGLLESVNGGTLCIEEINNMPFALQNRLFQVLTEKKILRVGGKIFIPTQFRLITVSTEQLHILLSKDQILKELYLHLSLFSCHVPSLAERIDDFEALVKSYFVNELKRPELYLDAETMTILRNQHWEGNIQELFNVLSHLACLAEDRVSSDLLPFYIHRKVEPFESSANFQGGNIVEEIEKRGFLDESRAILEIYFDGKRGNRSFGREVLRQKLKEKNINLSPQQLRLRQERLNQLGLLKVRLGRAGTTISPKGEALLEYITKSA